MKYEMHLNQQKFLTRFSFHEILHFLLELEANYFTPCQTFILAISFPDARVVYSSDALNRTFPAYGAHIFGPFFDVWIGAEYK